MEHPFQKAKYELDGCKLRSMTSEDAHRFGTIFSSVSPWSDLSYEAALLESYLNGIEVSAPRFSLMVSKEPVGAIVVRHPWLRGPYLEFLAIDPAYQAAGLGSQLVRWFVSEAEQSDCRNAWVVVSKTNQSARRLYEQNEFAFLCEIPGLVKSGYTELLMRRELISKR